MNNIIICVGVKGLVTYDLGDVTRREEVKYFSRSFFFIYRHHER